MTQDGFCPYKQKSEHALTTIISLCMCPFMSAKLCLGYVRIEKSPDLVLYLITLKWSYASSPHVFQHLNIHMWVYNCLSPYNLLRLICFISPKPSSESDFFSLCVSIVMESVCMMAWRRFFSFFFWRFSSCISFAVSFWVISLIFPLWVAFSYTWYLHFFWA